MKVFVLYREKSDHARRVETFARDFEMQTNKEVELLDMDSREADEKAKIYGVVRYPAVVAARDDGQWLKTWDDPQMLPRIQEVDAYSD